MMTVCLTPLFYHHLSILYFPISVLSSLTYTECYLQVNYCRTMPRSLEKWLNSISICRHALEESSQYVGYNTCSG